MKEFMELLEKKLKSDVLGEELSKLEKAIEFSKKAHQGQGRKIIFNGKTIPFITHPLSVALILKKGGFSNDVVIAGLLHDTVEDTETTIEEIQTEFGSFVGSLVSFNTENKDLTWEERKKHTFETISSGSIEERSLVIADKLDNLTSFQKSFSILGEKLWENFKRGRTEQAWYFENISKNMKVNLDNQEQVPDFFYEFENLVNDFFGSKQ